MEDEIWKPIVCYESYYEVSSLGRVRSIRWRGGYQTHLIHHRERPDGYVEVVFTREKKNLYRRVHQLVAEAFIPNPDNKPQVDHIDGDRANNRVENLRWCTNVENANNPITLKRKSESQVEAAKEKWRKGCYDAVRKPVVQYSLAGEFLREWDSSAAAAKELFPQIRLWSAAGNIADCCRREKNMAYGFIWVHKGNEDEVRERVLKIMIPNSIRVKVRFSDGTIYTFDSINRAAKELGLQNSTIRNKTYSKRLDLSWELLNTHTRFENRWGGRRDNYRKNKITK